MVNGSYETKSQNYERIICIDNRSDFDSIFHEICSKDIVLTINQDVISLCADNGISNVDIESIFSPHELFDSYVPLTGLVRQIEESIKTCFQNKINNQSSEVFGWFNYLLKILIDQIILNKRLIEKSLSYYSINKIVICKDVSLKFTNQLIIDSSVSMLSLVAQDIASNNQIVIDKTYANNSLNNKSISYFSFGQSRGSLYKFLVHQPIFESKLIKLRSYLRDLRFFSSIFIHKTLSKKPYFLSVECRELDSLSSNLRGYGVEVMNFNSEFVFKVDEKKAVRLGQIILDGEFCYEGFDFREYLVKFSGLVAINAKRLLIKKKIVSKLLSYSKPSCVFVQTLSAFNINSMIVNSIANEIHVKLYCWMHGGYGGYFSLSGFDVTDFRHTKNHIVYGEAAKDAITNKKSILRSLYPDKDFNVKILGSPFIESFNYKKKISQKTKKKVVFSLPGIAYPNSYYFGYDRPYDFLNWQIEIKKIIIALSEYEDTFDITIKDYPNSPQKYYVKKILKKIGKNKIQYLSYEQSYLETLFDVDVLIYPWVSTSLMEGFQTNADILVFDDSRMLSKSKKILSNLSIFETNIDKFISELHSYFQNLDVSVDNNFKVKSNLNVVKSYYINSSPADSIANELANLCND